MQPLPAPNPTRTLRLPSHTRPPARPPTTHYSRSAAGLAWTAIAENPRLLELFKVLSLSVDRRGKVYVSTIEAHRYPITATQW